MRGADGMLAKRQEVHVALPLDSYAAQWQITALLRQLDVASTLCPPALLSSAMDGRFLDDRLDVKEAKKSTNFCSVCSVPLYLSREPML